MPDLEFELAEVERLRRDLSAEIVLQEEEGHSETYHSSGGYRETSGGGYWLDSEDREGWVVDKPRKAEPDIQKREAARQQLQQIYDSSEWCTAMYLAGIVLDVKEAQLENQINEWLNELEKSQMIQKAYDSPIYHDLRQIYKIAPTRELREKAGRIIGFSENSILADELRRSDKKTSLTQDELEMFYAGDARELVEKSGRLLGYSEIEILCHELYSDRLFPPLAKDELRRIYIEGKLKFNRERAGQKLGYSSFRIWLHELFL